MRAPALYGTLGALLLTAAPASSAAPALPAAPAAPASPTASAAPSVVGTVPGVSPATIPDPMPASGALERALAHRGTAAAAADAAAAGIGWQTCPETESLPPSVRCGTVTVPVDYTHPEGEKLRLTVSRKRATGPEEKHQGALLYNPGGPGGNGMAFPLFSVVSGELWRKINTAYDFVGYAPRGVGRSAPLSCASPRTFSRGPNRSPRHPTTAFKQRRWEEAAAYARGCARKYGERLGHFTTPDNARDLEVIRAALGQPRLSFLGVSYGSYIGSVYATLFPGHVRRLVLDSVVDPRQDAVWYGSTLAQNRHFERRWTDWKKWTARHDSVYGLGRTPRGVQRAFDRARDAADRGGLGRTVGAKELLGSFLDVGYDDSTWARHASALADFREGRRTPLKQLVTPDPHSAAREENSNAVYHAVQCSDAPWPRDWSRWNADSTRQSRIAPFSTWENTWMNLPCASWRTRHTEPVNVGTAPGQLPPTLLLAASRDAATPHGGAVETQRRLPGSSLVTEKGAGSHGVADGNACVDAHLVRYLLEGVTPGRTATCAPRPAPRPEHHGG